MRRDIIGAIIVATLAGCGSITLAPEDLGTGNDVTPDRAMLPGNLDGALNPHDDAAPEAPSIDAGTLLDAGPVTDKYGGTDTGIDGPDLDTHDLGAGVQTCEPATCYRKSDPDHTSCPCHY